MNTISNDGGPVWLPNLRERFGDVSISGAERLLKIKDAQDEIKTSIQEALYAIAGRLNPKPKKDVDIGELLRRAVDKGDAEARTLANWLSTWGGKSLFQFTLDLDAPCFVPAKDDLAVWSGLAGSEHPCSDDWNSNEVYRTLVRAHMILTAGSAGPGGENLDYARAAMRWADIVFGPENGSECNVAVWKTAADDDGSTPIYLMNGCEALAANLEKIARRLNLVGHESPPHDFFLLDRTECALVAAGGQAELVQAYNACPF